jgi:ribonuclease Z
MGAGGRLSPKKFSLTFLGTASASLNPFLPTACCLVELGETKILIDAGMGVSRQLRRLRIDTRDIDAVLISHWHFDHFVGLLALLSSRKSNREISIYGPEMSWLAKIYLGGTLRAPHTRFETVKGNFAQDCGSMHIEAVPTSHGIASFGWVLSERIAEAGRRERRIVVSGDTRPVPAIIAAARGADLLVHEATFPHRLADRARTHDHTTPVEAANLAVEAGVAALALTHLGSHCSRSEALAEAGPIFPGVMVPELRDRIDIGRGV